MMWSDGGLAVPSFSLFVDWRSSLHLQTEREVYLSRHPSCGCRTKFVGLALVTWFLTFLEPRFRLKIHQKIKSPSWSEYARPCRNTFQCKNRLVSQLRLSPLEWTWTSLVGWSHSYPPLAWTVVGFSSSLGRVRSNRVQPSSSRDMFLWERWHGISWCKRFQKLLKGPRIWLTTQERHLIVQEIPEVADTDSWHDSGGLTGSSSKKCRSWEILRKVSPSFVLYTMRRIPHAFPIFFVLRSNVINSSQSAACSVQPGSLYSFAVLLLVENVWSFPTRRRATCDQAWM